MEYLSGCSLADSIRERERLSIEDTLELFFQISRGLKEAHEKGILHRDIKPSNIFLELGISSKVKIVDFGLATVANSDQNSSQLTVTGNICGSPLYMSPEQSRGDLVDARSDIYSLDVRCTRRLPECLR